MLKSIFFRLLRRGLPVALSGLGLLCPAWASTLYTYVEAESPADSRQAYNLAALRLALEKTLPEYGTYQLRAAPRMNTARALEEARRGSYPNLLVMTSFQNALLDSGLDYARFPVDLGVTGYRICFVSPAARREVAGIRTLDVLRRFRVVQGVGWADVAILRHNGFRVETLAQYEDLFLAVADNRADLFCRGVNELDAEFRARPKMIGLDYDRTMALVYPLPRFFFSNRQNGRALERIGKGLRQAYRDGSLQKLWRAHYQHAVRFARLQQRHLFHLETPGIDRIDFDFRKYFFDPARD